MAPRRGTVLFVAVNLIVMAELLGIIVATWSTSELGNTIIALVFFAFFLANFVAGVREPGFRALLTVFWILVTIVGVGFVLTADHLDVLGRVWRDEFQTAFGVLWALVGGFEALSLWLMNRSPKTRELNIIGRVS